MEHLARSIAQYMREHAAILESRVNPDSPSFAALGLGCVHGIFASLPMLPNGA